MLWLAHANGEDRGVHGGGSALELRGCVCLEQSWMTLWCGREGWHRVPAETSGIAAHPKVQLPEGFQPLFRMVGELPRVKGAVLCGSGWAGSHWRCIEPTVLSLLVGPAQGSSPEQGKHVGMLCQNTWQCCSSSCSRMKSSWGVAHSCVSGKANWSHHVCVQLSIP